MYEKMLDEWREDMKYGTTNMVAPDFRHGKGLRIGEFCVIEKDVIVGDDVTICNYVLLKAGTRIGDGTFVDSYVKSSGNNRIGNNVVLRFNATIAREVTVEDDVFVSPNVMTMYGTHERERIGGIVIGERSFIGTNAVIGPGVKIAPGTVVGALALVNKDIEEPGTYAGIPARKL
jgi:acetyltransferase-like isoleucine patch superfamily enzyme